MAQLQRVETSSKSPRNHGSTERQQLQHHPHHHLATGHEHHRNEATARIATVVTSPAKHPQNQATARIATVGTPTKHHHNEAAGKIAATVVTTTTPTTPMFGKNHDQDEIDHIRSPSNKKSVSVIAKVKEKAKKWKHNLVNKKKHNNSSSPSASPSTATPTTPPPAWGVSLDDDDDNDVEDDDKNHYHVEHKEAPGEPAEYLGAPMYESEHASNDQGKHSDKPAEYLGAPMYESERASNNQGNHPDKHVTSHTIQPVVSDKHVLETKRTPIVPMSTTPTLTPIVTVATTPPPRDTTAVIIHREKQTVGKKETPGKTITETVTEKFGPAYAKVSEATQSLATKIQNVAMPTTTASSSLPITSSRDEIRSGENIWDKGVSVKEYLISKLEPGDEEKALSEVISDAMSPKTITGDTGVVEKVREAVSSMLGIEQATPTLALPEQIPVSTNPQEVFVEEKHERRLQAN